MSKVPVRLRRRKMPSGNESLYLDIYYNGNRKYEYLNLYLTPETSRKAKEANKSTLQLAETICAKRLVEFQQNRFGLDKGYKTDTYFLEYFRHVLEERKRQGLIKNDKEWKCTYNYLERYCSPRTTFRDIDANWVNGFKSFLNTANRIRRENRVLDDSSLSKPLAENTKLVYFTKLKTCLFQAYKDNLIQHNPIIGVQNFKKEDVERVFLTLDEVKALAVSQCPHPILKRAFLFSCLTGIRKGDIERLTWGDVKQENDAIRVIFKQKKTGKQEYYVISPEAVRYLGERGTDMTPVFQGFHYSQYLMKELKKWVLSAGITKDVTFHTGRHTFAVLMLTLGADIYTVQRLLGHKSVQTTMIYANILDEKKQEAVSRIPNILSISE